MHILIFILLKILEISMVVFLPYGIGWFACKYIIEEKYNLWRTWGTGFMFILAILAALCTLIFIYIIFCLNWSLSGAILK